MKFKIVIDSVEREVDASADGTLIIDGKSYKTEVSGSGREKRAVRLGDKTYEVRFVDCGEERECSIGEYVLELAGERVPVAVKEVLKSSPQTAIPAVAPAGALGGPAVAPAEEYKDGIFAPVPGKIVEVKVKAGDTVNEGDLVLILEAMKMENELHAPKRATVAAVLVNKGDQAAKGQLLVAFG